MTNRPPMFGRIFVALFIIVTIWGVAVSDEEAVGERLAGALCGGALCTAAIAWGLAAIGGEVVRFQQERKRARHERRR